MYQDPYQTQAQFDAEAAEIDAIQAAQYADEDKASAAVTAPDHCGCCGAPAASAPKGDHDECCSSLHDTPGDSRVEIISVTPAATASAAARAVTEFDARLIRTARELAALSGTDDKRAWLIANDRPEAATMGDSMVSGMITGNMQYALISLANGYERELQRNA